MWNFLIWVVIIIVAGVHLYAWATKKKVIEVYRTVCKWFFEELFGKNGADNSTILMNEYKTPIIKALNDEGIKAVERGNAYCQKEVCYYFFQLHKDTGELDLEFLETLVQTVFYTGILPLYDVAGVVSKEEVLVYIERNDRLLKIIVGHSATAHEQIYAIKENLKKRQLEELEQGTGDILE